MALAWETTIEINGVNTKKLIHAAIDRATDLCGDIGKPTVLRAKTFGYFLFHLRKPLLTSFHFPNSH